MDDKNRDTSAFADLEPNTGYATLPEDGAKAQATRVDVYVTSYRKLDSDPDGVSVKAALDGIVANGILPDDSSKQIKRVIFETVKGKEEKTIIEIKSLEER